jgi:hypothetical protein
MAGLLQLRLKSIAGRSKCQLLGELANERRSAKFSKPMLQAKKGAHMRTRSDQGMMSIC